MAYDPTGAHSATFLKWEADGIAQEAAYEQFIDAFGADLQAIGEWIESAPDGIDIEAALEMGIDAMEFDASDDGDGTNWDWVYDVIASHSPRLTAKRASVKEAA